MFMHSAKSIIDVPLFSFSKNIVRKISGFNNLTPRRYDLPRTTKQTQYMRNASLAALFRWKTIILCCHYTILCKIWKTATIFEKSLFNWCEFFGLPRYAWSFSEIPDKCCSAWCPEPALRVSIASPGTLCISK